MLVAVVVVDDLVRLCAKAHRARSWRLSVSVQWAVVALGAGVGVSVVAALLRVAVVVIVALAAVLLLRAVAVVALLVAVVVVALLVAVVVVFLFLVAELGAVVVVVCRL